MFRAIGRFIIRSVFPPAEHPVDPWSGSGGFYVTGFRPQLDEIAAALSSERKEEVRTRFNAQLRCAELADAKGRALIRVAIHGEGCAPERAIVTFHVISQAARRMFRKTFPLPVTMQTLAPD